MDDLRTVIQETWSKALLAASSASSMEEQAQAVVRRVGNLLDGASPQQLLAEVKNHLQALRQDLQEHVQQAVKAAVDRLRLPSRAEVEALRARLAELEARLHSMEADRAGPGGRPSA